MKLVHMQPKRRWGSCDGVIVLDRHRESPGADRAVITARRGEEWCRVTC